MEAHLAPAAADAKELLDSVRGRAPAGGAASRAAVTGYRMAAVRLPPGHDSTSYSPRRGFVCSSSLSHNQRRLLPAASWMP
jgi:hypothetical protein